MDGFQSFSRGQFSRDYVSFREGNWLEKKTLQTNTSPVKTGPMSLYFFVKSSRIFSVAFFQMENEKQNTRHQDSLVFPAWDGIQSVFF